MPAGDIGNIPAHEMLSSAGLPTLLALSFIAKRAVAAPAPVPRGDSSVSPPPPFIFVSSALIGILEDFLGELSELRGQFYRS